jgi:serine/threonine-protein kinase
VREAGELSMSAGRIVGRYILYDEIASGGMASVHLGRLVGPVGFSRTVAIKRLHPQLARDPEFSSKFLEEARLAARVRHPNVVSVIDVVAVADELFLVMEYVTGDSLSKLAKARARIPLGIGLTIVADALYGLHAAHETKSENGEPLLIVHRDVSPQNIVVGVDGVARVLDFGVAKAASQAPTQSEVLRGKLAYMAPEQFRRGPVDRRADIFAASIVLWEVITGRRLFAADEPAAVLNRVLYDEIERPSAYAPSVTPALEAIVMRGLSRDVEARWATAHEMATALEAAGVALARPAEIGEWVAQTAKDTLVVRAELVARIERDPAASASPKNTEGGTEPAIEPTLQLRDPDMTMPPPRRPRAFGLGVAAFAGAVCVIGMVVLAASRLRASTAGQPNEAPPAVAPAGEPAVSFAGAVSAGPSAAAAPDPLPAPEGSGRTPTPAARGGKRRPARGTEVDCTPPYYFDDDGVKRFKPKCI